MSRTVPFPCFVLLTVPFAALTPQEPPRIGPGARVRPWVGLSASSYDVRQLVGTYSGYDSGNIGIKPDCDKERVWVPLSSSFALLFMASVAPLLRGTSNQASTPSSWRRSIQAKSRSGLRRLWVAHQNHFRT